MRVGGSVIGSRIVIDPRPSWAEEMLGILEPSAALWRTIEANALASTFARVDLRRPVLDLGCGEGGFTKIVFGAEAFDCGLEIDERVSEAARRSGVYGRVVTGDGQTLPLDDCSFHTVFSNSVIEHIDDLDAVLCEVARVLAPGGRFVATVPIASFSEGLCLTRVLSRAGLGAVGRLYARAFNAKLHHVNLHDEDGWRRRLAAGGLLLDQMERYLGERAVWMFDRLSVGVFARKLFRMPMHRASADWVRAYVAAQGEEPYGAAVLVATKMEWRRAGGRDV